MQKQLLCYVLAILLLQLSADHDAADHDAAANESPSLTAKHGTQLKPTCTARQLSLLLATSAVYETGYAIAFLAWPDMLPPLTAAVPNHECCMSCGCSADHLNTASNAGNNDIRKAL